MSTLDLLGPYRTARIQLPTRASTPLHLECVAYVNSAPYFETVFLPGELPAGELTLDGPCQLHFEVDGRLYSIKAKIESLINEDRLRLLAQEISPAEKKRAFFRVDSKLSLDFEYHKSDQEKEVESFRGLVNLSGGGVYFPVRTQLPLHSEVKLNLVFGDPFGEVRGVVGEVVRIRESLRGDRWVGVKFVKINPKDRDLIIAYCLAEQRKILRMRVVAMPPPDGE